MIQYAILLIVPVIIGTLIAAAILALNGLLDRNERKRRELDEARRLDRAAFRTNLSQSPAVDRTEQRIAS
jgi:hypothetical protein